MVFYYNDKMCTIDYTPYKLLDWINIDKLDWELLSLNPNAIYLLEKNPDKIDWECLSTNLNAILLLEKNQDKIDWRSLSERGCLRGCRDRGIGRCL